MGLTRLPIGIVTNHNGSEVSVPSGQWETIAEMKLPAGVWVVVGGFYWQANSSGNRKCYMWTSGSGTGGRLAMATPMPSGNGATQTTLANIAYTPTSELTIYARAWQSSGSALNCSCYMRAVRII